MNVQKIMASPFALKLGHIRISGVVMYAVIVSIRTRKTKKMDKISVMSKKLCVLLALIMLVISCVGCSTVEVEKFSLEKEIQGSWLEVDGNITIGNITINIIDGEYTLKYEIGGVDYSELFEVCNGTYSISDDKIYMYMREYEGQLFSVMKHVIVDGKHCLIAHDGTKYEKVE